MILKYQEFVYNVLIQEGISSMNSSKNFHQVKILRVFAVSDIHVDYKENLEWIFMLPKDEYSNDILILAGDVSSRPVLIQHVFEILKTVFMEVMYVPGNHDLWVRKGDVQDSKKKFLKLMEIADENSVLTKPAHFGDGKSSMRLWY